MATEKQIQANRQNALESTGPRTDVGKAAASLNAVKLGIYALSPVVNGLEKAAEWEEFRAGIVADLAPVGAFEHVFAERVAGCLWRLRRVTSAEAAGIDCKHSEPLDILDKDSVKSLKMQARLIPEVHTATKIARYESHLSRQLSQALHELQRLQEMRIRGNVAPPAVLDMTVHGGELLSSAVLQNEAN